MSDVPSMNIAQQVESLPPYGNGTLPAGIRSRMVDNNNGLMVHVLEAGFETPGRPCLLLLHGFPELAYSWRKVMLPLAAAGYHVIAPDQRGYGRTTGWDGSYDADGDPFRILNMVRDATGLVHALGYKSVAGIAGPRRRLAGRVLGGADPRRRLPQGRDHELTVPGAAEDPVQHRERRRAAETRAAPTTSSTPSSRSCRGRANIITTTSARREANDDMLHAPQGLHAFFRAYYHYKSADWKENKPHPLKSRTAEEMAKIPTYYVMERDKGMAETVAPFMPSPAEIAACKWLTDAELGVYVTEYSRTGFTGALQGYRVRRGNDPRTLAELRTFSGRTVDVPACFIAGKSDWGSYQTPGELEAMQGTGLHEMARHAFRRRRRPLGAAGAAGGNGEAADRILRRTRRDACGAAPSCCWSRARPRCRPWPGALRRRTTRRGRSP